MVESARNSISVPEGAEFSLVKAERFGSLLKVRMHVVDAGEKLRWFDAERVMLHLPLAEAIETVETQAVATVSKEEVKGHVEQVSRVGIFAPDGTEQSLNDRLLQEEADFTFYFNTNELVSGQAYRLIYKSLVGEHELISSVQIPYDTH